MIRRFQDRRWIFILCFITISFLIFKSINLQSNFVISTDEICPLVSPILVGEVKINSLNVPKLGELERRFISTGLKSGGRYKPAECQARNKVAIIIPYDGRNKSLQDDQSISIFMNHLHPFLQRQQLEYAMFVVEQSSKHSFNRTILMNIGYKEVLMSSNENNYGCFIFHDVDLLPENDHNLYSCPEEGKPRQMAFSVNINHKMDYTPLDLRQCWDRAIAFSTKDFSLVNGFPNSDQVENMYDRAVKRHNLTMIRYPTEVSHYTLISEEMSRKSIISNDDKLVNTGLSDLSYRRLKYSPTLLFTHILVDL